MAARDHYCGDAFDRHVGRPGRIVELLGQVPSAEGVVLVIAEVAGDLHAVIFEPRTVMHAAGGGSVVWPIVMSARSKPYHGPFQRRKILSIVNVRLEFQLSGSFAHRRQMALADHMRIIPAIPQHLRKQTADDPASAAIDCARPHASTDTCPERTDARHGRHTGGRRKSPLAQQPAIRQPIEVRRADVWIEHAKRIPPLLVENRNRILGGCVLVIK